MSSKCCELAPTASPEVTSGFPPRVGRQSFPNPARALLGNTGDRSLGAPLADIEGTAHLGPRKHLPAQFGYSRSVNVHAGPSELLTLGASIAQSGLDALLDERPLELRHGADDLEPKK